MLSAALVDLAELSESVRLVSTVFPGVLDIEGLLEVVFDDPVDAPAPGQSVVCYENDIVLGGGIITSAS